MTSALNWCDSAQAQIHSQDHFGPVLRFGPAGSRLNVEKGGLRIELPREHTLKFEFGESRLKSIQITGEFVDRILILFGNGHFEQLDCVADPRTQIVQNDYHTLELRSLATKRLGALRLVPYIGLLEFSLNLCQSFRLFVIVKDTSSTQQCVRRDQLDGT